MTFEYQHVDAYVRSQIDGIFKNLEKELDKVKVADGLNRCKELLNKLKPHCHDPLEVFIDVLKYKKDMLEKIASRAIAFAGSGEIETLKAEYQSVVQDTDEVADKLKGIDYSIPDDYDEEFFKQFGQKLNSIRANGDYIPSLTEIIVKYDNIISDLITYIINQHDSQEKETDEAVEDAVNESQEQLKLKLFNI